MTNPFNSFDDFDALHQVYLAMENYRDLYDPDNPQHHDFIVELNDLLARADQKLDKLLDDEAAAYEEE